MIQITPANKKVLQDAFSSLGKGLNVPNINAAPLEFAAYAHERAIQIDVTNNPNIMGYLNVNTGMLEVINLANKDTSKNSKSINLIDEALQNKYAASGVKKLDEGLATNEHGRPQYYWQTYFDGEKDYSFRGVNLARDLDFADRKPAMLVNGRDNLAELCESVIVGKNVKFQSITNHDDGSLSINFKVNGDRVSFSRAGEGNFNVWANFGDGAHHTGKSFSLKDVDGFKFDVEKAKAEYQAKNAKEVENIPKDRLDKLATPREHQKYSVTNPTPLQMLVMWTELEPDLKKDFANNPYSIGGFKGYKCPAGVPTCGFGSTGAEYKAKMGVDAAFAAMNEHIDFQRSNIREQVGEKYFDKLLPREQDALTSLGYNTGSIGEGLVSLVQKYANNPSENNRGQVTDKILEYCQYRPTKGAEPQVSDGLLNRREFEVAIFKGQIDSLSSKDLQWLVPASIESKTRQQLERFCDASNPKEIGRAHV